MKVKWHGKKSSEKKLNGSGPQGSTFGVWEYLAQSNDNANFVDPDYRYKFVDDLTVLEKVNLLTVGLTTFNYKNSVPSDIPNQDKFIPPENLNSAKYIQDIQNWTKNKTSTQVLKAGAIGFCFFCIFVFFTIFLCFYIFLRFLRFLHFLFIFAFFTFFAFFLRFLRFLRFLSFLCFTITISPSDYTVQTRAKAQSAEFGQ